MHSAVLPDLAVCISSSAVMYNNKGRSITGHEGPQGEYIYSSTLSLTSALEGGEWSTPRPGRFTPGKDLVPIVQEAGWALRPVWTGAGKLAPPTRIRYPDRRARSVVTILTELSRLSSVTNYTI